MNQNKWRLTEILLMKLMQNGHHTRHTHVMGTGFSGVWKCQPVPVPVPTHDLNPYGFVNLWHSLDPLRDGQREEEGRKGGREEREVTGLAFGQLSRLELLWSHVIQLGLWVRAAGSAWLLKPSHEQAELSHGNTRGGGGSFFLNHGATWHSRHSTH